MSNIHAGCNPYVDIAFMKAKIAALERLDLEQAAAVVIAAVRNDSRVENQAQLVSGLINGLDPSMLTQSCMWIDRRQWRTRGTAKETKMLGLVRLFQKMLRKFCEADNAEVDDVACIEGWKALVPYLLRVRRFKPPSKCLFIPGWIFQTAKIEAAADRTVWDKNGYIMPGQEPMSTSEPSNTDLILSRKEFRRIQRRL